MNMPLTEHFDFRQEVTQYDLIQDAPVQDWQLGLPLGNGLIGAMLWGGSHEFLVTLNRSDLWDLKWDDPWLPGYDLAHLRELWDGERWSEIQQQHDHSRQVYGKHQSYFQPAGRVSIHFDSTGSDGELRQRLCLYDGRIEVCCGDARFELSSPPELPVVLLRIDPGQGRTLRISVDRPQPQDNRYPEPTRGASSDALWLEQELPEAPRYRLAVFLVAGQAHCHGDALTLQGGQATELALAVVMGETADEFERLRKTVSKKGCADLVRANERRWHNFWKQSFVRYPDRVANNVWFMSLFLLACSSQKPGWPPNLQGIWSDWDWPPWHGDYHHDLNTQMNYWGIDGANHPELGLVFYDFWKGLLSEIKEHTRKYYGLPGIRIPTTADPKARELGGYFPVAIWVASSAWVVYHYWLYYEHTMDDDFLRDTCYPMLREQARFCAAYLRRGADGRIEIFPSHSPEQGGNSLEAIGKNSTIDLLLFRMTFEKAARAAEMLDLDPEEREDWKALAAELPDYPTEEGVFIDLEDRRYRQPHRHLSVLSPIYPGESHHRHAGPMARQLAERSYREFTSRPGFGDLRGDYCHFTPQWLSLVAARLGLAQESMDWFRRFLTDFILPNGLATLRVSDPETLFQIDCNGGAIAAVNESLMQSHAGGIDLFPGIPSGRHASFYQLRARGAFLVSARKSDEGVRWVHLRSEKGGTVKMFNPWPGRGGLLNDRPIASDDAGFFVWDTSPDSEWILVPEGGSFEPLNSSQAIEPGLLWRELHPTVREDRNTQTVSQK